MKKYLLVVFLMGLLSCNDHQEKSTVVKQENNEDPVKEIDKGDKAMNAAITLAQESFNRFLEAMKNPDENSSDFSVKMRFTNGDSAAEHMWLNHLHFNGDKLFGVLDSEPVNVTNVSPGDSFEVRKEQLSDWMYVKNHKMVGGYTIKVIYDQMNKQEQKEFRDQFPFDIE